ncbi:hypothetical protein Y032_0548g3275 [Ancylostoma ceylanicum]|uniref:DUF1758 domain-containing protein n=1 Tax=Ancylostoma ceylanicum TaxID=53326 RepID=A0A016WSI0_9BILA|nr:hypothetical protein Y032_0548g3275 [Ancylostoma ceylanicum]
MTEIKVFKTKITNACAFLNMMETEMSQLEEPFAFPSEKEECQNYIRDKKASLNHIQRRIKSAKEHLDAQVTAAIGNINTRQEQKEREKLMSELNKHLETDSNTLDFTTMQWLNQIEFRREELMQQTDLITRSEPGRASINNGTDCTSNNSIQPDRMERNIQVRRPLLEVPQFSGNFREFNAFWSVFESLIHNDRDLTDIEKFLFLKQALRGKAAAAIQYLPVIGEKYQTAVKIVKKHFDKSASMADILINEIERLPRAKEEPESCRETFEVLSSHLSHLEQTGVAMNADRVWRRLILSKFPEFICRTVIQKENEAGKAFDVNDIAATIDDIITLQETTSLITKTLFDVRQTSNSTVQEEPSKIRQREGRCKRACLCGEQHSPYNCTEFNTPESRRAEACRQRVCWKCFDKGHNSLECKFYGPCPNCMQDHHSSLCSSKNRSEPEMSTVSKRQYWESPKEIIVQSATDLANQSPMLHHEQRQSHRSLNEGTTDSVQTYQNSTTPTTDLSNDAAPQEFRTITHQYVLPIAAALIFNEDEQDYQPVTMLLDSGAQRSFIKTEVSDKLKLPIISSTSYTTTGIGELQETFTSKEVVITLKGLHTSKKLQRLSVHTKEKLTAKTKTAHFSKEDRRFIKDQKVTIAHGELNASDVSPDLLIGQDLLSSVVDYGAPTLRLPSGLVLMPTIFGYTASGTTGTNEASPKYNTTDSICSSIVVATQAAATGGRADKLKLYVERQEIPREFVRRGPIRTRNPDTDLVSIQPPNMMTINVAEKLRRLTLPNLDIQVNWKDDVLGFISSRKHNTDAVEDICTHSSNHDDANYRRKGSVITKKVESVASGVRSSAIFTSLDGHLRIQEETLAPVKGHQYINLTDDMDFVPSLSAKCTPNTMHVFERSCKHTYDVSHQKLSPSTELYANYRKANENSRRRYRHQLRMAGYRDTETGAQHQHKRRRRCSVRSWNAYGPRASHRRFLL